MEEVIRHDVILAQSHSFLLSLLRSSRVNERGDLAWLQHPAEGVDPTDDLLPETLLHRLRGPEIRR